MKRDDLIGWYTRGSSLTWKCRQGLSQTSKAAKVQDQMSRSTHRFCTRVSWCSDVVWCWKRRQVYVQRASEESVKTLEKISLLPDHLAHWRLVCVGNLGIRKMSESEVLDGLIDLVTAALQGANLNPRVQIKLNLISDWDAEMHQKHVRLLLTWGCMSRIHGFLSHSACSHQCCNINHLQIIMNSWPDMLEPPVEVPVKEVLVQGVLELKILAQHVWVQQVLC